MMAVAELPREEKMASATSASPGAAVIVNADDWGRDAATTDRILECIRAGVVSSTSAMVFMEDSERSTALARQYGVDTGLHLNLTTEFSAGNCPARLRAEQRKVAGYLRKNRLCRMICHPGLRTSFARVVEQQLEEYERLYGRPAARVDGHHHMHLCANVERQALLPAGIVVRRNFSFGAGERGGLVRLYRARQDQRLARRHPMTDYFFTLPPLQVPGRLAFIFSLAAKGSVEVETHPVNPDEYRFLMDGAWREAAGTRGIAPAYTLQPELRKAERQA